MKPARRPLSSWMGRRAVQAAVWFGLIIGMAVLINALGVRLVGSVEMWHTWLHAHAAHLLIWRIVVYAGIGAAWWRMRKRLLAREPSHRYRLLRAEIGAAAAITLLETSQWLARG